ncbi:MAG: hypothetical protein JSW33_05110, partial [bacterium]
MDIEKLDILIGNSHRSHLILRLMEKSTQKAPHEKCCRIEVIVSVGNFKGSSQVIIEESSIWQLQQALQNFSTNPVGEFTFSSVGREFWASIRGDNSGKFEAYCLLDDHENKYTRL